MKKASKNFVPRAGVAVLIVAVVVSVAVSFRVFVNIDESAAARKYSFITIGNAEELLSAIKDAETGQRGYLLTGDTAFLKQYRAVHNSIRGQLKDLRQRSTIDSANKHLDALVPLVDARLDILSGLIELRRNNALKITPMIVELAKGKRVMDTVRVEFGSFIRIEREVLAQHDADFQASMRTLFLVIVIASLIFLLLAVAFVFFIYRESQQRLKDAVHLETKQLLDAQEQANLALQVSEEKYAVTLNSIGDGVIATDSLGRITLLNAVAQQLTGWTLADAAGRLVDDVFNIVNEETRGPRANPVKDALAHGTIQFLANHTILISRAGSEYSIADSCAPIRDRAGQIVGAVLVFRDVTEKTQNEMGLEKTRKELEVIKKAADEVSEFAESIINTVREPLLSLDQDLRVVTVSRSFYEFFKVNPEDTVGQLIYDLGNKQWDIPKLRELLENILPQKASFDDYEVEHDFATIGKRTMLLNARQIERASGKERIILLAIEDITARKEIENGLEKTRKELEVIKNIADEASELAGSLINTVREPLLSLDQDLRVVAVSRSFYEFFKVKPEETVGQLIYDLGNKQWDIPKLRELLETILPQKASFDNYEVEHDFATIGKRTMLLNARQIQRASGKERIILLAIEDITERKQIANDLQQVRNELERIVQVQKLVITDTKESLDHETEGRLFAESEISHRQEALEVVYAMETDFDFDIESLYDQIVTSISTTLRTPLVAIYEYRDGKIVRSSKNIDTSVSREIPHARPCAACQFVLDNKNPQQVSGNLGRHFGANLCFDTARFHSYAGVTINGSQNEIFGMITILDDKKRVFTDSEIKFVETFARYIAHELSRRDLESRLRRGEEMRLLGQLTSGVAHEVRNPLNGILAIMGALSKELQNTDRFNPYLQHMRDQITRLTDLMEALLALGRPLREENMHEISMVTSVENALLTWHQTQDSSKPMVQFEKPDDQGNYMVIADNSNLTQIIINLLENAYKHSPAAKEIACSVRRQDYNLVVFSVSDRGTGIAVENLSRIFDPFFTTRKDGTGLGLSIVRQIVENHKGSVRAYNNADGVGATFEVVLPLYVAKA